MNLEKLDADERGWCVDAGKSLAEVSARGFDGNEKLLAAMSHLSRLSPQTRRILLNQMILCRIFFVYDACRRGLDKAHADCLLDALQQNLRKRLSPVTYHRFEDNLRAGTQFPLDNFSVCQLAQQAGFSLEELTEFDPARLQEIFTSEAEALKFLVDGFIKILNTPPPEREKVIITLPVKQPARKTIPIERPAPPVRKKTSWGKWLAVAVVLTALFLFGYDGNRDASPKQRPPAQTVSETAEKPKPVTKPKPIEPVAKIGVMTGYDYEHPILNDDGLCEFTVANTRNDMPVYVRIWDVGAQLPVRAFTIAQGDKFTAENLSPGIYEVRYKELYENAAPPYGSKSEPTTLEQIETYDGTSYSIVELTLYKVHGGNTTTTRIDADDV